MTTAVLEKPKETQARQKGEWTPRIWEGCDFFAWARLLARGRFKVDWSCLYIAAIVTFISCFHTALRFIQELLYGRRIARTPIRDAPIFIIGHWRTGTTFLHELLILDERHTYPTTYECLEPNHFLLSERLLTRIFWFLVPSRRPMDNMAAGWDRPQEDEFALCMLGQPSPYVKIAFPNDSPDHPVYLDLEELPAHARASWKRAFYRMLQRFTVKDARRLVLKSPPHTCRIKTLLELFPDARFVHVVRNPYIVFPSTVHLWKSFWKKHGLQRPTYECLEEYVYSGFEQLYAKLEQTRHLVHRSRFYEVAYEDFVADPIGQMEALYEHLGLGGFEQLRPRLEHHLASIEGYETNRYELTSEQRAKITRRWGDVIRRYGYSEE